MIKDQLFIYVRVYNGMIDINEKGKGSSPGRERGHSEYSSMILSVVAACIIGYLVLKYVIGYILPFIIGYITALCCIPLARRAAKYTGLSQKHCRLLVTVLFFTVIGVLVCLAVRRGVYEIGKLIGRVGEGGEAGTFMSQMLVGIESIGSRLPLIGKIIDSEGAIGGYIKNMVLSAVENTLSDITAKLADTVGKIVSSMPSILLFLTVAIISGFYFCVEFETINTFLIGVFPKKVRSKLPKIKRQAALTAIRYLRASLILLLLTAAELYFGFIILGIDYSLLLAFVIAVVDILPVLGVGTVLIPWAVVELLMKHYFIGVGLLILYAVVSLLRQIAEPRILGKSLGVHPLVTLISTYVGYKLLGFSGMILAPFAALALSCALKAHDDEFRTP